MVCKREQELKEILGEDQDSVQDYVNVKKQPRIETQDSFKTD